MPYDLANQLKHAGFPQSGDGKRVASPDTLVARRDDFAYVPTLEELIEACGQPFWLETNPNWTAGRGKGMNTPCSAHAPLPPKPSLAFGSP